MKKTIFCIFSLLVAITISAKDFVLVIDAGHGGKDPGAVGQIAKEKDFNLAVAKAFGQMVMDSCKDVKVIFTRDSDNFVELNERANIANRNKADLFISIHTNSSASSSTSSGTETYALGLHRSKSNLEVAMRENSVISMENDAELKYEGFDPNSSESYIMFEFMQDKNLDKSIRLANLIQKQYKEKERTDRGVFQAGFLVLRATSMPAILTEIGFISNPVEEQYLNSPEGQMQIATSIFNGFRKYKSITQ